MPISIVIIRNRTASVHVGYGLYFYFSGLSLRGTSKILSSCFAKRNRVSIWNWIQNYNTQISSKKKKALGYVIDETALKVGPEYIWL